jgi:hypothetical protein
MNMLQEMKLAFRNQDLQAIADVINSPNSYSDGDSDSTRPPMGSQSRTPILDRGRVGLLKSIEEQERSRPKRDTNEGGGGDEDNNTPPPPSKLVGFG